MPTKARMMMREGETLLDVCLETHMSITGSSDPLSEEEETRNMQILATAIFEWEHHLSKWRRFDEAVLELCKATYEESLRRNWEKPTN